MRPAEEVQRPFDLLQVEGRPDEPGVLSFQDRPDRTVADPVNINLAFHIEAGVKGGIDLPDLPDGDIRREKAVDPHEKIPLAEAGGGVKMGDLAYGMHPRIRPTRTDDPTLLAGHPADGFLENLLDGKPVFLALPAAIGGAVIFDDQSDISHVFKFHNSADPIPSLCAGLSGDFLKWFVPLAPDGKTSQR